MCGAVRQPYWSPLTEPMFRYGPMFHDPEERSKALCQLVGNHWVRRFPITDHPCLDVTRFRPDSLDFQTTHNCVCSVLSPILSGTPAHVAMLEEIVRRECAGPDKPLTVRFDGGIFRRAASSTSFRSLRLTPSCWPVALVIVSMSILLGGVIVLLGGLRIRTTIGSR